VTIPPVSLIDQISAAMSVRSLEHQAIASNIANRDTQGYQRLKVQFDHALDHAGAFITTDKSAAPISVEEDLVALSTNVGRYQALARSLSRYFSIISTITTPNRG
jgi:flagellar basal-body rod protein FlgB